MITAEFARHMFEGESLEKRVQALLRKVEDTIAQAAPSRSQVAYDAVAESPATINAVVNILREHGFTVVWDVGYLTIIWRDVVTTGKTEMVPHPAAQLALDALNKERRELEDGEKAAPGSWVSERDAWCTRVAPKMESCTESSRFCWLQAAWQESFDWVLRTAGSKP